MAKLVLEVVEGPDAGRNIPVEGLTAIGRAEDGSIMLADPQVSRHHARVWPVQDGLGSRTSGRPTGRS